MFHKNIVDFFLTLRAKRDVSLLISWLRNDSVSCATDLGNRCDILPPQAAVGPVF